MSANSLCPICRTELSSPRYRPFCSKRCADVDLGRWLTGGYAIAGEDGAAEPEFDGADGNPADSQDGPTEA